MEITEVRIKLMENSDDRLQAFCSITFDNAFVVRDLKIIEGTNGPFVAMPSRKLTAHCSGCGAKNHLRASFCNHCGEKLREDRTFRDQESRAKLYADIAHPINSRCRELIQHRVITEYQEERERSHLPDYVSRYDEDYAFDAGEDYGEPFSRFPQSTPEATRIDRVTTDTGPRPPHVSIVPPIQESRPRPHQRPRARGDFGAGIFDS